jgi:hypothetical protein
MVFIEAYYRIRHCRIETVRGHWRRLPLRG